LFATVGFATVCLLTSLVVRGLGYNQATKHRSRPWQRVDVRLKRFIDHVTGSRLTFKL
jgi:hypothetical protein